MSGCALIGGVILGLNRHVAHNGSREAVERAEAVHQPRTTKAHKGQKTSTKGWRSEKANAQKEQKRENKNRSKKKPCDEGVAGQKIPTEVRCRYDRKGIEYMAITKRDQSIIYNDFAIQYVIHCHSLRWAINGDHYLNIVVFLAVLNCNRNRLPA